MQMELLVKLIFFTVFVFCSISLQAQVLPAPEYKICVLNVEVKSKGNFVDNLDIKFSTVVDGDEIYGGDELIYMYSDSMSISYSVTGTDTVLLDVLLKCKSCLTIEDHILLTVGKTRIDDVLKVADPVSVQPLSEKESIDSFDKDKYRVVSFKVSKEPNRVDYSENGLLSLRFNGGVLREVVINYVFN